MSIKKGLFTPLKYLNFLNKYNNMRACAREGGLLFFLFGILRSRDHGPEKPQDPLSNHIAKPLKAIITAQ